MCRTLIKGVAFREYYLISAQWVGQDNSHVGSVWMNRAQNLTVYSSCYAPNWTCSEVKDTLTFWSYFFLTLGFNKVFFQTHSEKATDEPWLEVHQKPVYSEDGSAFLLLAAVQEGGGQYYTHIKHVDVNRQRIAVLSHGRVEVAEVLAWDQENHLVYYLGKLYHDLISLVITNLLLTNDFTFYLRVRQ